VVPRLFRLLLAVLVLVMLASPPLHAAEPGEELTISLLTMGPGAHPFTKFGHSAIWVHDEAARRDDVYNYGTFAFDSKTLLLDSVAGKLPYWLSVAGLRGTVHAYEQQGRSLLASELELTPSQRVHLHRALRENARPENRYYRYDYYRDNCATRLRDIVDDSLGGRLKRPPIEPASMSYREHTHRLVADNPLLYAGMSLGVGRQADTQVSFWDEAWLPERLHEMFARTTVTHDGKTLPLIRSERELLPSRFPPPRTTPPSWGGYYAALGLTLGLSFAGLGLLAKSGTRAFRVTLGALYLLFGSLLGLLGCMLCYLTFFSAHSAAASNYNVLLLPPWLLALSASGIGVARGKPRAFRIARWATLSALCSSTLALVFHALNSPPQANLQELAFALPLWLGMALSTRQASENPTARPALVLRGLRESDAE